MKISSDTLVWISGRIVLHHMATAGSQDLSTEREGDFQLGPLLLML